MRGSPDAILFRQQPQWLKGIEGTGGGGAAGHAEKEGDQAGRQVIAKGLLHRLWLQCPGMLLCTHSKQGFVIGEAFSTFVFALRLRCKKKGQCLLACNRSNGSLGTSSA